MDQTAFALEDHVEGVEGVDALQGDVGAARQDGLPGVARLTEVGPNRYELWVNKVAFPHYFRGLLEAGLEFGGAAEVKVEVGSVSATEGVVFGLSWK